MSHRPEVSVRIAGSSGLVVLMVGDPVLACVGESLFAGRSDAIALIHQTSRGLPRAVNNLAVQALLAAYATNTGIVDESSARQAVKESTA